MSVTAVKEIWSGRDFDSDKDVRRYTRVYMARTSARTDEGFVIQAASLAFGLPVYGQAHPSDPLAYVNSVRGVNTAGPFIWTITVGYSTEREFSDNPLNDPVEYAWDDLFASELSDLAWPELGGAQGNQAVGDMQVMTNSAGDPYDKPVSFDTGIKVVTLSFNLDGTAALPSWFFDLPSNPDNNRYSINDTTIDIDDVTVDPFTARFERAAASPVKTRNSIAYREITCRVAINRNLWAIDRLDEGFRQVKLAGDGETPAPALGRVGIQNQDGTDVSKPVPLDGNGRAQVNPQSDTLVTLDFYPWKPEDFTTVPGIDAFTP